MRPFIIALFVASFSFFATPAFSQSTGEIRQCGTPEEYDLETDPGFVVCDIYQRQLQYKPVADKLKQQLKERQANFAEPRRRAYEQYQKDLQAMHERGAQESAAAEQ